MKIYPLAFISLCRNDVSDALFRANGGQSSHNWSVTHWTHTKTLLQYLLTVCTSTLCNSPEEKPPSALILWNQAALSLCTWWFPEVHSGAAAGDWQHTTPHLPRDCPGRAAAAFHKTTESQNVRGWKGPLRIIWFKPPCQSRVTYSSLHRVSSRWVLNISREGDSTTPLGSLFQDSVTLRVKKFAPFAPLSCHWAPLKRVWPHPPHTHPSDIYKHLLGPLAAFSSSGWTSPAPSASPRIHVSTQTHEQTHREAPPPQTPYPYSK